ncbi:MAG: addiction module protein [Calditrichaeota bacterium]|nr:addiction module protein [Calditrichota bacterium]
MSLTERFQIMELLWESFMSEQSQIEPPDWHGDLIKERMEKIENKTASFIPLEKLKTQP